MKASTALQQAREPPKRWFGPCPAVVAAVRLESGVELATARVDEVETCRDMLTKVEAQLDAGHRYESCSVGHEETAELTEWEDAPALDVVRLLVDHDGASSNPGP